MKQTKKQLIKLLKGQVYSLERGYLTHKRSIAALKVIIGVEDEEKNKNT